MTNSTSFVSTNPSLSNTRSNDRTARFLYLKPIVGQTVVINGTFKQGTYPHLQLIKQVTVYVVDLQGYIITDRFNLPHINVTKNSIKSCHFNKYGKFEAQAKVYSYIKSNGELSYGLELIDTDREYLEMLNQVKKLYKCVTGKQTLATKYCKFSASSNPNTLAIAASLSRKIETLEAEYYLILDELLTLCDGDELLQECLVDYL